jgi:type II secretory pathway component PulF
MTGDKIDEGHPFFLVGIFNDVSAWFSSDGWAYLGLVLLMAFVAMLLVLLFNDRYEVKKIMLISAVVTFFLSGTSIAFSAYRLSMLTNSEHAIVGLPTVSAKSSPTDQGTDLFIVHEGSNVQMLDSVANWREIRLPDGNRGWVEKQTLMPI